MKKYILVVFLLFLIILSNAQTGDIIPSIDVNNPVFVQGAKSFQNILTDTGAPVNTQTVWYCILDGTGSALDSSMASLSGNNWVDTLSMDTLNNSATTIIAHYYDSSGAFLDISNPYSFTIKSKPISVSSGYMQIIVDSISAQGIAWSRFIVAVPDSNGQVSDSIVGLGGKQFGIANNQLILQAEYNLNDGNAFVDTTIYSYQLIAFDAAVASGSFGLDTNFCKISLDSNLNPYIEGHFKASKDLFHYSTRDATLPLPIKPASVSVGAELSVKGGIASDFYFGFDSSGTSFGFIQTPNGELSNVSIGANITGSVRVTASLFSKHLAGIRASLTAVGHIAASYQFQTVPQNQSNFLLGGDLLISGKVELTGLAGKVKSSVCGWAPFINCDPDNTILEGAIWPFNNGGQPRTFGSGFPSNLDSLLHALPVYYNPYSRSNQVDSNYLLNIPNQNPQPAFASRGESVGVAWIEADSVSNHLLFATLDTTNKFNPTVEVSQNDVMLSDPQASIAPDGSAIIVWSQSSLLASDITNNMTIDTLLNALEVWYAVYDPQTNSITSKSKLYEANGLDLPSSKPMVAISDSGKAIITWLSQDSSGTTDIWYCTMRNGNGIWYQSTPDMIYDEPGNNYNVQVCFVDSSNAIAAWISDPDANDTTGGNEIIFSSYDGSSWSVPTAVGPQDAKTEFNEISMDFNQGYGALAYTSTTYIDTGIQLNQITTEIYHNGQWQANNEYVYLDSTKSIRIPRVSISDLAFVAVSYQTNDLYESEDGQIDAGEVNIALNDLNNTNGWQIVDFSTEIAQDTNIYVWDMDVMLSRNNTLYTLSQEQDTALGGQYTPHTGRLFGSPDMGLVLRGMKVNDDLSVNADSTSTLPEVPTGLKQIAPNTGDISLLAFPNPFKDKLTIEFTTGESKFISLEAYDLIGQKVGSLLSNNSITGRNKIVEDYGQLAPGIYILKLASNQQAKTLKLIKE